jgi:isoleucyl-tRNA synthetase
MLNSVDLPAEMSDNDVSNQTGAQPMAEKKLDWKDTLNLPRTDFPMKAQLSQKEPETLKKWETADIYKKILDNHDRQEPYILHDGPPYANGNIHLGTALNKILKDFIVKSKAMAGFYSPYVPGWDCHGLPIEHKVDQQLGSRKRSMSQIEVREECRKYAEKFLSLQREDFKRLGIFGAWEEPYTTLNMKRRSSAFSILSSKKAMSTAKNGRYTGASPARPPWPKPKSNTPTTARRPSR